MVIVLPVFPTRLESVLPSDPGEFILKDQTTIHKHTVSHISQGAQAYAISAVEDDMWKMSLSYSLQSQLPRPVLIDYQTFLKLPPPVVPKGEVVEFGGTDGPVF